MAGIIRKMERGTKRGLKKIGIGDEKRPSRRSSSRGGSRSRRSSSGRSTRRASTTSRAGKRTRRR